MDEEAIKLLSEVLQRYKEALGIAAGISESCSIIVDTLCPPVIAVSVRDNEEPPTLQ